MRFAMHLAATQSGQAMSINLHGLEHYQSHQQLGRTDRSQQTPEATGAGQDSLSEALADDDVSLSDASVVIEWIAGQAPDLSATEATAPANLGRLSDHLLRYDLISLPESGRLMSLAAGTETTTGDALSERIQNQAGQSETWLERQQWHKLGRLVSNLGAAQARRH